MRIYRSLSSLLVVGLLSTGLCVAQRTNAVLSSATNTPENITPTGAEAEGLELNPNLAQPEPKLPGWNLSVIFTPQHDSASGWATSFTPAAGWRINKYFSFDASVPIYTSVNVANPNYVAGKPKTGSKDIEKNGEFGDTTMAAHFQASDEGISYTGNAALSAPTGDSTYGLGTGYVGWNYTNHLERNFDWLSPEFDFGIGNSSSLTNRRVAKKTYSTHGDLVNIQGGFDFQLPKNIDFEMVGYGIYPLGNQTIATQVVRNGKTKTQLISAGDAEDNGVNIALDFLVNPHLATSVFYSRSQYLDVDTVGVTLTFLLRGPKKVAPLSAK
jgi:hypothetical protein